MIDTILDACLLFSCYGLFWAGAFALGWVLDRLSRVILPRLTHRPPPDQDEHGGLW